MKRILSVQDISCIGRCSQTVALPVISAMGCRCDILPTAILSTHTAFPCPHKRSLTADIAPTVAHWKSIDARFDTILVGYLADQDQVAEVQALLACFDALKIVDPAMGDHGKLYGGITPDHAWAMRKLCCTADILLPNITEAAYLTGFPYREKADPAYCQALLEGLMALGVKAVVLTGTEEEDQIGFYCRQGEETFAYHAPRQPDCHGTGDLFAAAFAGGLTLWGDVSRASLLAAEFVEKALEATKEKTLYGVEFERVLPWLTQQLKF